MPPRKGLRIGIAVAILLIGLGVFFYLKKSKPAPLPPPVVITNGVKAIVGTSVEGREIESYTYGNGEDHLLFVGGVHGGYEWNSVLLAYQAMDYFKANIDTIPQNLTITIIPSLNPDGVFKVVGKEGRFAQIDIPKTKQPVGTGRFNAHGVDLNRNFDCKWKPESMWRGQKVSAGEAAFSEPEAQALRDVVLKNKSSLKAVVFWHSQANAVYASECTAGILPVTLDVMNAYAQAGSYKAIKTFDAYEVTGDAEGWLASINIPAITVELKTHETVEWPQNLASIKSLITYFGK
jgi:Zinc carboxypeptidase